MGENPHIWSRETLAVSQVKAFPGREDSSYNTQNVLETQLRFPAYIRTGDLFTSAYTDRMVSWDYEKFRALKKKHCGNEGDYFERHQHNPEQLLEFFAEYFDMNATGLLLVRYTNVSNGFPVWHGQIYACGWNNREQPVYTGAEGPNIISPKLHTVTN